MVTSADCTRLLPPGSEVTLICGVGCYVFAIIPGCLCAACLPDSAGSRLDICYRTTVAKQWAAATAEIAAAKIATDSFSSLFDHWLVFYNDVAGR